MKFRYLVVSFLLFLCSCSLPEREVKTPTSERPQVTIQLKKYQIYLVNKNEPLEIEAMCHESSYENEVSDGRKTPLIKLCCFNFTSNAYKWKEDKWNFDPYTLYVLCRGESNSDVEVTFYGLVDAFIVK